MIHHLEVSKQGFVLALLPFGKIQTRFCISWPTCTIQNHLGNQHCTQLFHHSKPQYRMVSNSASTCMKKVPKVGRLRTPMYFWFNWGVFSMKSQSLQDRTKLWSRGGRGTSGRGRWGKVVVGKVGEGGGGRWGGGSCHPDHVLPAPFGYTTDSRIGLRILILIFLLKHIFQYSYSWKSNQKSLAKTNLFKWTISRSTGHGIGVLVINLVTEK